MPFVKRSDLPEKIRKPHEKKLRGSLRAALHQPGLSAEIHAAIKTQLSMVGQPKQYGGPPKQGAIPVARPSRRLPSVDELMKLSRPALMKRATQLGLPKSGTKMVLTTRIRDALSGQGGNR